MQTHKNKFIDLSLKNSDKKGLLFLDFSTNSYDFSKFTGQTRKGSGLFFAKGTLKLIESKQLGP